MSSEEGLGEMMCIEPEFNYIKPETDPGNIYQKSIIYLIHRS